MTRPVLVMIELVGVVVVDVGSTRSVGCSFNSDNDRNVLYCSDVTTVSKGSKILIFSLQSTTKIRT